MQRSFVRLQVAPIDVGVGLFQGVQGDSAMRSYHGTPVPLIDGVHLISLHRRLWLGCEEAVAEVDNSRHDEVSEGQRNNLFRAARVYRFWCAVFKC